MKIESKRLLKDPRVVHEIDKHKWIESEKAGRDIGFDHAADDWITNYSDEWVDAHLPDEEKRPKVIRMKKNRES